MSCHRYCKTAESALSPRISCCGSCIYPRSLRSLCPGDSGHSKPCLFPQCLTAFYPHTLYILSQGRQAAFIPLRLWFFSHLLVVVFVCVYIHTHTHIYIYVCVCVCVYIHTHTHIYIYIYIPVLQTATLLPATLTQIHNIQGYRKRWTGFETAIT